MKPIFSLNATLMINLECDTCSATKWTIFFKRNHIYSNVLLTKSLVSKLPLKKHVKLLGLTVNEGILIG